MLNFITNFNKKSTGCPNLNFQLHSTICNFPSNRYPFQSVLHYQVASFFSLALGAYNSRRAGVSAAIAMSVLIPFLICGACLIFRWRASMSTNQDFGGNGNSTSHNVYQRQQNNPMQHQITKSASFSDDEAVPKSSRLGTPQTKQRNPSSPHQGVYYTNEPLDMYTRN